MAEKRPPRGALPPPRQDWMMGLTAASITFVREAELYAARPSTDVVVRQKLEAGISEVMSGRVVLADWLPIKNFLRNGFKTR